MVFKGDDEHLEARIKDLGIENNTTKNRLESLESWIVKQDENKVKENDETIRNMKDIITNSEDVPKDLKGSDNQVIKCKI